MDADALLPAAPALLGDEATDIVGTAVTYAGGQLRGLKATQVQYRPGKSVAVLYDARVQWPKRDRIVTEGIVAMTSVEGPPAGALPVEADGMTVGVWRISADPLLPGLAVALAPDGARRLLGGPAGPVSVALRSYRPTRRAVVALTGLDKRFAKVVRPSKTYALRDAHERFAGVVAAPAVLATDADLGIVTLAGMPGRSMVDAIASGDPLPSGRALLSVLDAIASVPATDERPRSARRDAKAHAALLSSTLPAVAERVDAVVAAIGDDPENQPTSTIHGDFYEAQLLVSDGEITGVLDLDRSGLGSPADDLATMLAHLSALGIHRPGLASTTDAYAAGLWRDFRTTVDADDLRSRVAAVLVGLATGPFRTRRPAWQQETARYLDCAQAWLDDVPLAGTKTPTPTGGIS